MQGAKPLRKIKTKWSPAFAYAVGLLTTDGCLSCDGRHVDFTSKDREQLSNFMKCLGIHVKIGYKISGFTGKRYPRIQFSDVNFYKFMLKIGLTSRKSRTLANLKIPNRYFFDFLRGHFDGDGTFYYYWDSRWRSSFMFYTVFISASEKHINWLQETLLKLLGVKGHIIKNLSRYGNNFWQLKYAKLESLKILKKMYESICKIYLRRKRLKIEKALAIIGKKL